MRLHYRGERYKAAASPDLVEWVESGGLHSLDFLAAMGVYAQLATAGRDADFAYLGAVDRFWLLTQILDRRDMLHPWLYDRTREVELEPNECIELWARDHRKSTITSYAGSIQEILNDPEITIAIFSHTADISEKFVDQVRREFEGNHNLRSLYPQICWVKPTSEAPIWTKRAFTVRRRSNPKEATIEAHGLVKGQPTSRHFKLRIYDDPVTLESVSTPEMVRKTTEAWELSDNLGTQGGRRWHVGTRWSFGDSWGDILDRGMLKARIYPATHNGKLDGKPVLLSQKEWDEKKKTQRSTVAAQMLQNPLSGKERTFEPQWFRPWYIRPTTLNVYILGDPSRGKSAKSDRTAIAVIGQDSRGNRYLLDGYRHRMTLSQRWDALKHLHKKWSAAIGVGIVRTGYERYGQQSDDEYFRERMREEGYAFQIEELSWPREGEGSKKARVERLQPDFEFGSFYLPALVHVPKVGPSYWSANEAEGRMDTRPAEGDTKAMAAAKKRGEGHLACQALPRRDEDGNLYDLTLSLMEEMLFFPFGSKDDLVDAVSRIYDIEPMNAAIDDGRLDEPAYAD